MRRGFTLLEVIMVVSLLTLLLILVPGIQWTSINQIANQDEVQRLVNNLRLAQRRAVLTGVHQYLTLEPSTLSYRIYEISGSQLKIHQLVELEDFTSISVNRSINDANHTFYYTPQGAPVFGCTITLKDLKNTWDVVIAVASGTIRIDKE